MRWTWWQWSSSVYTPICHCQHASISK